MISIFIFNQSQKSPLEIKGEGNLKLMDFLKDLDLKSKNVSVYDLNLEKDLDLNVTLDGLGVKNNHRLVVASCKKVDVTVDYAGQPSFIDSFNPHNRVEKVLKEAVKHFKIPAGEQSLFELFLELNSKQPLPRDLPICTILGESSCSLNLFLAKPVDYKGYE